jgi:predicted negative regulator of RcsB-dependent stress response
MDWQQLINLALGSVLAIIGWFARQLWDAVQHLKTDVNSLELHVVENYVKKDEINVRFDRIEQLLDKVYEKLDKKADR